MYHYPHDGSAVSLKAKDGPWKGLPVTFHDCCPFNVLEDAQGRCVGRYAMIQVQQKNRVVRKAIWDGTYRRTWSERLDRLSPGQRYARLRRGMLHDPSVLFG